MLSPSAVRGEIPEAAETYAFLNTAYPCLNEKQLAIGDTCFKYKNNQLTEVQIKNMTEKAGAVMTYNISRLEKNKTYFANGMLVSDEQSDQ